jgi:outer membrane protein assembly factor BamD (BamD/ComL family)
MTKTTATLLAAALMLALGMHDADAASEGDMAPTDKASNQLYWDGQTALRKSDWTGALKRFQDLEKLLREKEPKSADASTRSLRSATSQASMIWRFSCGSLLCA